MKKLDEKLRFRLCAMEAVEKSAPRLRNPKKLGAPEEETKSLTYCRKGYRYIGQSKVVQKALSNKRLEQRGIPFALYYYLKVRTVI